MWRGHTACGSMPRPLIWQNSPDPPQSPQVRLDAPQISFQSASTRLNKFPVRIDKYIPPSPTKALHSVPSVRGGVEAD